MRKLLGRLSSAWGRKPDDHVAAQEENAGASEANRRAKTFQPNNDLERLLMAAASDPAQRGAFQQLLLKSELFAVTPEPPLVAGHGVIEAGSDLSLLVVSAPDGKKVTAVFTSLQRVGEVFGAGVGVIHVQGEALLEFVVETGMFLNPGLAYGAHWDSRGVAAMLGRPETRTMAKVTQVQLAMPAEPPLELVTQLRALLGARDDVPEAWLALAHWPENGEFSWYLDIRTNLDRAVVRELMSGLFKGRAWEGRPLDVRTNEPGGSEGVGIRIAPARTQ